MKSFPSLFPFLFLFLISSCKPSIPKDVLPPSKMNPVLWDILLADEMASQYSITDSTFNKLEKHAEYYQDIFKIHKTDEQTFKRSIRFYMEHPALFKPVLDSLQSRGDKMQQGVDSTSHPTRSISDTLHKRPVGN
jgi:hypothetical protein